MIATEPKSPKKQCSDITLIEAERAIYIDFEGFEEKAPHLIGVLIDDTYQSIVLDPELTLAADAKQLPVMGLNDLNQSLVRQCVQVDRYIIGFTSNEKNVVQEYADIDISHRYRDAHKVAKTWANRLPGGKPESWRLVTFLKFIGFEYTNYGQSLVTKWLRAVIDKSNKEGSLEACTPTVKSHWTKLLKYNEQDCRGTKAIMLHALLDGKR
jgi:hypothetical protein